MDRERQRAEHLPAAAGLLRAHYARPPGRGGPGAGRSAKYYEPSDLEIEVAVPPRRYDLVALLLAEAVVGAPAARRAQHAARERGATLGEHARTKDAAEASTAAARLLGAHGFEPYRAPDGRIALGNCPFRALAEQFPEVVCEMNRAFVAGLLDGLGAGDLEAVAERAPGDCCVTLRPRT